MKMLLIFLALIFSFSSFAERVPASLAQMALNERFSISYGYQTFDEMHFTRKKNHFEVQFVDRSILSKKRNLRRAMPIDLAQKKIFDFNDLVSRFKRRIEWSQPIPCATNLEIKNSKLKGQTLTKAFCLDGLSESESKQFVDWITSMMQLFNY